LLRDFDKDAAVIGCPLEPLESLPPGLGSDLVGKVRNAVQMLVLRCECGVESRGDADELVRLVQHHARSVHNMTATREQILERARPA
jgi:predicted small metal-binding protein